MLESVYSVSDNLDPLAGVRSIIADCRDQLGARRPSAGLFFTSCMEADFQQMLTEIDTAFPDIELIGCTTDGEITPQRGFTEDSSALLLLISDDIVFSSAVAENISDTPETSIGDAYKKAMEALRGEPSAAFLLPDGLTTMDMSLDVIFQNVMGHSLPIFGGLAGDAFALKKTYQFYGDQVFTDAMPFLLLDGALEFAVNIARGPVPYGDFYEVDKIEGNTVYSIGGITALEFYERFLGEYLENVEISFFPLAVYGEEEEDFVLRDPVTVNRGDGSITFLGRIQDPCKVRLTQVSRDETLKSANLGADHILNAFDDRKPELVLLFCCTSRRHVLGSRTDEEFEVLRQGDDRVPFFGFYCYGEIGPFSPGKPVNFHSDTCVFVGLRTINP